MKRKEHQSDSSDAEMEVDNEEKHDIDDLESDSEVDGDEENAADDDMENQPPNDLGDPFLDSFYGLASTKPIERTHAAQVILHHSLLGPDANAKDGAYALKRLLNGLCSGRAANRQGMASALASFLKVAFRLGKMDEIRNENQSNEEKELTHIAFVRRRLLAATDISELAGRKRGAEERDYQFGRLFGINGIVRSGIMLPVGDSKAELDDIIAVVCSFVKDLIELYKAKKWMREPAAHAIVTLLNSYYNICEGNSEARNIVERIVDNIVVPELLMTGDSIIDGASLFATYSAEQVAVAVNIQANLHHHRKGLPNPIDKPVLCTDVIQSVSQALSETSSVTQPRTHLVWDSILFYITESSEESTSAKMELRKIKKNCSFGTDSVEDVIGALMQCVVVERLLGIEHDSNHTKVSGKTTHERSALALCIFRNLSGVEFVSSISGRTRIVVESQILDSVVFTPLLVKRLFLDIICAGTGGRKQQGAHMLKPLSLQILESIVQSATEKVESQDVDDKSNRRLVLATSFIRCDPRFDAKTKTSAVGNLLGIGSDGVIEDSQVPLLEQFVSFTEKQILVAQPTGEKRGTKEIQSYEAIGYVDLVFQIGKELLKTDKTQSFPSTEKKTALVKKIIGFLIMAAFFDCTEISNEGDVQGKKKKKKRKSSVDINPLIDLARTMNTMRSDFAGILPYDVRSAVSARFFSLVAVNVSTAAHSSANDKETCALDFLSEIDQICKQLERAGAKRLASSNNDDDMEVAEDAPEDIVHKFLKAAKEECPPDSSLKQRAQRRLLVSFSTLALTLYLHLLSCGRTAVEPEDDDPDADDEEDRDEIVSMLTDVQNVYTLFTKQDVSGDNPLHAHTELCTNVLSSHVGRGNQSRGASPTLIREIVKMSWSASLKVAALSSEGFAVESSIINVLLNAIGAIDEEGNNVEDEEEIEMEEGSGESDENDDDEEEQEDDKIKTDEKDDDDDSDVELDPKKLQSLLEEGSDAEVDETELEHHEGADAALAQLIQLRQDARKAGQEAIEKAEISRQLRCVMLIEILVVGKPDSWGSLLRVDVLLQLIAPIIHYRRELIKSLEKARDKGSSRGQGEKRGLVDRLSSLLKSKILKAKVPDHRWTDTVDIIEFCKDYSSQLLNEANLHVDKEHQLLCNGALMFMLRNINEPKMQLEVAALYGDLVTEWASKRSKHIDSSFFETLIQHNAVIAQACLTHGLATASGTAKSPFLKSECFRLLSLLFNTKLNTNESDLEKLVLKQMSKAVDPALDGIVSALKDAEMRKTKRVREVLKLLEKVLSFENVPITISTNHQKEFTELLHNLKDSTESDAVKQSTNKVLDSLATKMHSTSEVTNMNEKQAENVVGAHDATDSDNNRGKKSHKSKKKKSKKSKK